MNDLKIVAILVAGGSGSRMKATLPKQFLLLNGKPVLMHTLQVFAATLPDADLLVVLPADQIDYWKSICEQYNFIIKHAIVAGGDTRFESVKNGLDKVNITEGVVCIHDGVRPLVTSDIILNSCKAASEYGSGVTAVPVKDSVRQIDEAGNSSPINRDQLKLVQTPQTFDLGKLKEAYSKARHNLFTDDATVYEAAGNIIKLIEGSYKNLKITTPEDLLISEALLQS